MAHIVTNKCLGCKFTDCVLVCPVACFYELEGQLVIHPEECIDCMACVDECPVHAIYAEGDLPPDFQSEIEFNATEARRVKESDQGAIETKKDPLPSAAQKKAELGLLEAISLIGMAAWLLVFWFQQRAAKRRAMSNV